MEQMPLGVRYQRWRLRIGSAALCLLLPTLAAPASAQDVPQDRLLDIYADGVEFLNQGSYQAAVENLRRVFEADPAFISRDGSAALHLARAMDGEGEEGAEGIRIRGIEAMLARDVVDDRLVHESVLGLDEGASVPAILGRAYLRLLADHTGPAWPLHAAYTALLMSEDDRQRVVSARAVSPGDIPEFTSDAAPKLVEWWNARDPLPASPSNERLNEHLLRLAVAHREYSDTTRAIGLDDRGLLYLRLGPPRHVRTVSFDDARFFLDVMRFGVSMTPRDFPANEIWLYPDIDRAVYHVFAQDHRRRFRATTPTDLIPRRLQNATLGTDRQMNMAVSALAAMRHVYRALALTHADFGALYSSIDEYAMWQEERRMARMAGGSLEAGEIEYRVGTGASGVQIFVNPLRAIAPPNEFVRSSVTESMLNDDRARRARERVEPDEYFDVFSALEVDRLEASVRTSRFRNRDGSTKMVIDWGPRPNALKLSEHRLEGLQQSGKETYTDLLLRATSVVYDDEGQERTRVADSIAVITAEAPDGVMIPRSLVLQSTSQSGRIVLQMDRHAAIVTPGPPPATVRGPLVQLGLWEGEFETLPSSGFAMSDVRPHFASLAPGDVLLEQDELEMASPFPHDFAPSRGTLVLEFETYDLSRDAAGQTLYTIEYEVARREAGGSFQRLLGRRPSEVTSARTEHRGAESNTRERIVLDPSEWSDGVEIRITIRVADQHADRVVQRSLNFQS